MHNKHGVLLKNKKKDNNKLKSSKLNKKQIKKQLEIIVMMKFSRFISFIFRLLHFLILIK